MTLAFICGTDLVGHDPSGVSAFHADSPVVRHRYAKVAMWTGLSAEVLLSAGEGADPATRRKARRVALATSMLAIHDVLAVHGIRPRVIGGVGTGALVGAALARSLAMRDLFELLARDADGTGRALADESGAALAFLPAARDPEWYVRAGDDGVRDAGSLGLADSGRHRVVLLTGDRDRLVRLVAEAPRGAVRICDGSDGVGVHGPATAPEQEVAPPGLSRGDFAVPVVPLCSPAQQRTLTTADEVYGLFAQPAARRVDLDVLARELYAGGIRLGLVLGPSLPRNLLRFPFPLVHVEAPRDIGDAVSAIFELGVPTAAAA